MVQVYMTKNLDLYECKQVHLNPYNGGREPNGYCRCFITNCLQCTYEIFGSIWTSVSNIYYACLIRQIALNDEIDAFMGSFKLRLDLTNLDKYFTYLLMVKDFQVSTI